MLAVSDSVQRCSRWSLRRAYRRAVATCPVCGDDVENLAEHFVALADVSDGRHIMWLNRNVTKKAVDTEELARLLAGDATSTDRLRR